MPACSFVVPNSQIMSSKVIHTSRYSMPFPSSHVLQTRSWPKAWRPAHVMVSRKSNKVSTICCALSPLIVENEPVSLRLDKREAEKSKLIPHSNEVMHLLSEICDTTSIAEFELKLDGFHLHVTRSLSGVIDTPSPPPAQLVSASASSNTAYKETALYDQVSTTSLAITKSSALLERAADEGLVIIQSPKVGLFRRCRTIKGKRAPPACKEKQIVKEGQVICYIEQLGWEAPIESDVSGEVTKFLCEDGEPVGYSDPIIAILPSFPGIKKLPAES